MNESVEVIIVLTEPSRSKVSLKPIPHLRDVEVGKAYLFVMVDGASEQDNSILLQAEIQGDLSDLTALGIDISGKDAHNVSSCLVSTCVVKEDNYIVLEFNNKRKALIINEDGTIDLPTIN